MDKIDEFLKVDPVLASCRKSTYERYRTGLHWVAIGFAATAGGVGLELGLGLEAGGDIGIAGMTVAYVGIGCVALNVAGLRTHK